jgi:hypothetical protein
MTIDKDQATINQIDMNTQVVDELSRRGGQGDSAAPKGRKYSMCGRTRHTSRTYPDNAGRSKQ